MLGEGFSNPSILAIICSDQQYKVVPGSIVGMEKVGYKAEEA